jgi:hypothetical protein
MAILAIIFPTFNHYDVFIHNVNSKTVVLYFVLWRTRRVAGNIQEHISFARKLINKIFLMLILSSSSLCISRTKFISLCTTTDKFFKHKYVYFIYKNLRFKFFFLISDPRNYLFILQGFRENADMVKRTAQNLRIWGSLL